NGAAFGGGCELAASCDLRVGHAGVKLSMPPARLGIVYAARGLARFSALIGESRARELVLTARVLAAGRAAARGLSEHLGRPARRPPGTTTSRATAAYSRRRAGSMAQKQQCSSQIW